MKEYLYNLATDKSSGYLAAILKFFLLFLSFAYGILIRGLILFYSFRPHILKCKVISVGNITLGGTGKTSLVELISRYLKDKGHKVAILTRGYKRLANSIGDEPAMLLKNLGDIPVIVDKDRLRGAKRAIEEYAADTVILDDGMQQWRIKKDLEIVAISATQGLGNRHMIPRGILREPVSSLKRSDIFVLTKSDLGSSLDSIKNSLKVVNPAAAIVESTHQPLGFYDIRDPQVVLNVNSFKAKRVALISGIADPDSFAELINGLGIKVGLDLRFDDHHNYSYEELVGIAAKTKKENLETIITTEKDASRLAEADLGMFKAHKLLALRIAIKITKNEGKLFSRLLSLYSV